MAEVDATTLKPADTEPDVDEKLTSAKVVDDASTQDNSAFECNICLELAQDPVVTLCGHLYCWPCLYRCGLQEILFSAIGAITVLIRTQDIV